MSTASFAGERIAFFGGSFDPPHLGHIAVARAAQQALALDKVLFAPVGLQPLKPSGPSAGFRHRAAMTRLAIAGRPGFELSLIDAPQIDEQRPHAASSAPNYTVDTLARLLRAMPGAQLYLLLGADSFHTFRHWHRAAEIPFLAHLIVASRPGASGSGEDLGDLSACLPSGIVLHPLPDEPNCYALVNSSGGQSRLILLPSLNCDISATQLRNQIHGGPPSGPAAESVAENVIDPAVLAYIHQHHLYQ